MQDRRQAQRDLIRAECSKRHIKVSPRGQGYLLTGIGVRLMCADLADLGETDLQPYLPRKHVEP